MRGQCLSGSKDSAVAIEVIYDAIRKMKPSKKSEQYVRQYLVPLLTTKFQGLNDFIRGGGYATENELLISEKNSLLKQMRKLIEDHDGLRKEKERLQSELAARTTHCSRQCSFSREQYIKEQKNFLDSMMEDSEDIELYIRALKGAAAALPDKINRSRKHNALSELHILLRQKNSVKKEFRSNLETFIDDAGNPLTPCNESEYAPRLSEKETSALFAMETCILMLNKIAAEIAYKILSTLDYCIQLKHDRAEIAMRLSRLEKNIRKSDVCTNDLISRIEEHAKSLAISAEGEFN